MRDFNCQVFGNHEFVIDKQYERTILRMKCKNCDKLIGANLDDRTLFLWDDELERMANSCFPQADDCQVPMNFDELTRANMSEWGGIEH